MTREEETRDEAPMTIDEYRSNGWVWILLALFLFIGVWILGDDWLRALGQSIVAWVLVAIYCLLR